MTLLLHLFSAAALSLAAPDCDPGIRARVEQRLAPMLQQRAASGSFSGVVMIACKGQPLFSAAYGEASRAKGVKNTLNTRFNLGSMNKMWTAIAIAQLVEQGKVDVDASVGRYLPDIPNGPLRDSVKIRHLLTHSSGLGSYFKRGYLRDRVAITRAEELARFFMDDALSFSPGSQFQYSNAGFAVLGMVVEKVSGMSYFDYVRKNIIERAGMKDAAFITLPLPNTDFATGYAAPPGQAAQENTELVERSSTPAGGAYANAASVVAFSRALWSGKLVAAKLVEQFTTGKVDMMGAKYAFGFGESRTNGWRSVGHNGGAPGVGVDFVSFPDHDVDIVVLTNVDMPEATVVMSAAVAAVTGGAERRTVVPGQAARDSSGPLADMGKLPDTPVGRRTAAFLEAFSEGTNAIERFLTEEATPNGTSPRERALATAQMRERIGRISFSRVLSATSTHLVIVARAEKVGQVRVTTEVESTAPHRLLPRVDFNPYP